MFAGEVIGQAVTRHFRGPFESGICFGNPPHHLKLNGAAVSAFFPVWFQKEKARHFQKHCEIKYFGTDGIHKPITLSASKN